MKNRKADVIQPAREESRMASFEGVFAEHWQNVYRLLCRLVGDPAEAEDLALETFFRLYQRYPLPPSQGGTFNLGAWLRRVATNLGLHSIRSFKRREQYETNARKRALEEAPEDRPAELLAQREERRLARIVLSQMNERQAQLLVMRYSGMSYAEIASALNLSATSIGPLLLRAEREFEKRYRTVSQEDV